MKRIIERTEDGSATLFVPELDEHYHSVKGARTESQHIFINMGLKAAAAPQPHWKPPNRMRVPYIIPVSSSIPLPGKKSMH